ncbi:BMP family ABC transporter substrate-binding protein [Bacillus sp. FJAT-45037]|uniref:BMP family ABC transporter substrate-binding protein n=1 Tax=Bacillus sp. FJAT-45037 TaxID=2011007 RepID=UPI000C24496D|nr:BMP family ABC transporter substrate-binding protein [Bacillus sp. FJAT-45037]
MKIQQLFLICFPLLLLFSSCANESNPSALQGVGLLIEDTIDDQGWNSKGYQGLLNIHSSLDVHVDFKEEVNSRYDIVSAVEQFVEQDINLIFGHGHFFADHFTTLSNDYPQVHFISFNGEVSGANVTNLAFDSYAMGYFAGMVAAAMTQTDRIAAIAAFSWQPEVRGYIAGAEYMNTNVEIEIKYVEDWADEQTALSYFNELNEHGYDVYYPAGDGFHVEVVERIKEEGLYAIGYIGDQSDLGEATILTSTIQHVDELYGLVATKFQAGELKEGNHTFDFPDGVISLGEFGSQVPKEVQDTVQEALHTYMETGMLPHEHESKE